MAGVKTFSQILAEESTRSRGLGYLADHDQGMAVWVMSHYQPNGRFLTTLQRDPKGSEVLSLLLVLASNSNRQQIVAKVRRWSWARVGATKFRAVVDWWKGYLEYIGGERRAAT
jgi:hypothetical protein